MSDTTVGGIIVGSIVVVTIAAFKLIEKMQAKKAGVVGGGITPELKTAIFDTKRNVETLVKQHAPEGGVEMWKWPHEMTAIIRTIAETQRAQTKLLEMWGNSLAEHQRREEAILTQIRDSLKTS